MKDFYVDRSPNVGKTWYDETATITLTPGNTNYGYLRSWLAIHTAFHLVTAWTVGTSVTIHYLADTSIANETAIITSSITTNGTYSQ